MQKAFFQQLLYNIAQKPSLDVKTNFFRLMAVSQESGLGMRESMKSIMGAERDEEMKRIIFELLKDINEGSSLGAAIAKHDYFFEVNERELIKASEKMGNLPETLRDIAQELEKSQKIKAKLRKAISYPIGLMGFTIIAVAILLIFVIPTITDLYGDPSKLPGITKFMMSASGFLASTWWMLLVTIVVIIITYQLLYKKVLLFKKGVDGFMLKVPVIGDTIKTFYMFNFSKLFGDFGKAGVPPTDALDQMMRIFDNYFYKRKMMSMKNDLEGGFTISESIEGSPLFDPILIQIIVVGEKTGGTADILLTMSSFYRFQLERKIDGLMGTIEPVMMGFIACVIGIVVASVFLPLGGLLDQLGG